MLNYKPSSLFRTAALALLLGSAPMAMADGTQKYVVVVERNGSTYEVAMPEMDRITFAGDGLTISDKEQNRRWFDYSQVERILLGAASNTVTEIASEGRLAVWPSPAVDTVNVAGLPEGAEVKVFTPSGALVASAPAADGTACIDISGAPAGTLIVTADGRSVKIIKN